ncbi:hypothetical protein [Acidocella sp.]|uniref:hypothetical protein n=1 Tax=Acidocella sp. TaxID=50710 RepID=UPI00262F6E2A|nr:hypothetical protein [Acidocella sp.]
MDALVRQKLRTWPQHPPGLKDHHMGAYGAWMRARPGTLDDPDQPHLKLPGSNRLRTHPDGLWLCFGGTEADPFVDIFAIEACGSYPNLLDKRSRFAPSMHSMLAVCSADWLMQPVSATHAMPRWRYTGLLRHPPAAPLVLPVRDIRVMYALRQRHYAAFAASQIPHAHEFFAPVSAIIGPEGWQHPPLRAFIARTSPLANFFDYAGVSAA